MDKNALQRCDLCGQLACEKDHDDDIWATLNIVFNEEVPVREDD